MGREPWEKVWRPLLRGKFGNRAEDVSMSWLWKRLTVRRQVKGREARGEMLGYPRGGWQPLLERLRESIEANGGRVLIDRPAVANSGMYVATSPEWSFRWRSTMSANSP